MPVSVAVCETTNVVNAALRESLGVGIGSGGGAAASRAASAAASASSDDKSTGEDSNSLQSHIVANAKRILMSKIEYEEVPNYQESVLESLKSKYIVIKPTNPTNSCNLNGSSGNTATFANKNNAGKIVGANGHGK